MVTGTKVGFANGISNQTVCKVTFGGMGKVENEVYQIAWDIRHYNVKGWPFRETQGAPTRHELQVLPEFIKEGPSSSEIPMAIAQRYAEKSAFHVEIVGDGFGDFSFDIATATYLRVKELGIPTLVLVKNERKALHPEYATRFLTFVDDEDIATYKDQYQASTLFRDGLEKAYAGYLREG